MQIRARGLRELCGLLGYSSQAYYQYNHSTEKRTFKQEELIQQVLEHRRLQPRLGARKLLELMQPAMGRDAFFELLREERAVGTQKKVSGTNHFFLPSL
jgi:putative transposase